MCYYQDTSKKGASYYEHYGAKNKGLPKGF
jgi:hypothetical protein